MDNEDDNIDNQRNIRLRKPSLSDNYVLRTVDQIKLIENGTNDYDGEL